MFQYYGWNIAQYIVGTGVHAASFQSGITTQFNSLGWTLRMAYFNPNASAEVQLEQQFADVLNYPYRCKQLYIRVYLKYCYNILVVTIIQILFIKSTSIIAPNLWSLLS